MRVALKMSCLTLTLLVGCFVGLSSAQCMTGDDSPATMNPNTKNMLRTARMLFALDALSNASSIEGGKSNLFFSPHSLHAAVTLAYFGARNTTEASLKKALRIPDELSKVDVLRAHGIEKSLLLAAQKNSSYEYNSANRLWISSDRKVRDCMLDVLTNELEKIKFYPKPDIARKRINDWVSTVTKNQINDLLPSGSIDEGTNLVLANAVYFKGLWQSQFLKENTKRDIFYGTQDSIVKFMRQKGTFNHVVSETLGAHVLELPYKGGDISMFVFLPPFARARSMQESGVKQNESSSVDRDGIQQLIERITSTKKGPEEFLEILNDGMPAREVEISFPRFIVEQELQVRPLLKALGADEIFSTEADFRGFVADGENPLHLGDAVHRAKVDVNEEGTTAAAATAIFSFRSSRPVEPAVFKANHPFLYVIYHKKNQEILFNGVYRSSTTPSEPSSALNPKALKSAV